MSRTGRCFEVVLKDAHLMWGTLGSSRVGGSRSGYEAYLPIRMHEARTFNILNGEIFTAVSTDGYFDNNLKATGTQGPSGQYGKNLTPDGDMRKLGYWLKDRLNAQPGDTVRVCFESENDLTLEYIPQ
ncbi:TPA: hypothetical protein ROY02_003815 [Bacillus cereus]|uniref:hypothetical protein n=1 Tax=Bacillus cereus group TaxID=86661 RepID=UPI00087241FE|nr:hypothetical protein [Bacillus thuringiensis]HDR4914384.1 hypothetical protein [Bacillus cereus]OFC75052.1 hypothetical protein BTGOE1_46980 [Bacillus thuringiensis]OFC77686.1 hypothetical protein BTGOE2_47360 [Bacillus thuringiensis]HDR4919723.1 hypothetical protein [Bacillus cereus]HDX9617039.1 hypothetical protein [Bacillus thuringiensis]